MYISSTYRHMHCAFNVHILYGTLEDVYDVLLSVVRSTLCRNGGVWSTEGLVTVNCSHSVCCRSSHLTNFAVLVNVGNVQHVRRLL